MRCSPRRCCATFGPVYPAGLRRRQPIVIRPYRPGVRGDDEILAYFRRLLAGYPDWVWTNTRVQPLCGGFLNYWHATIPDGDRVVECDGVCTVTVEDGLIRRNEVFFDRSDLLH